MARVGTALLNRKSAASAAARTAWFFVMKPSIPVA
jgi:hypothetical protein